MTNASALSEKKPPLARELVCVNDWFRMTWVKKERKKPEPIILSFLMLQKKGKWSNRGLRLPCPSIGPK